MVSQYQKDVNELVETAMMQYSNAKELGAFRGYVMKNFRGVNNWEWLDMVIRKLQEAELEACNHTIQRILDNDIRRNEDASEIPF